MTKEQRDHLRVLAITAATPGLQRVALGLLGETLPEAAKRLAGSPWLSGYAGKPDSIEAIAIHLEQHAESADLRLDPAEAAEAADRGRFIPGLWCK